MLMTECSDFISDFIENVSVPISKGKQRTHSLCQTGNNLTDISIGVSET